MKIAMMGHKRIPSREGGIEIVVDELSTRLVGLGHCVTAYNRRGHHVSGSEYDRAAGKEYNGIRLKNVFTVNSKSLNAIIYSILAGIRCAFGRYDVVHIHAEGPASVCFLPKLLGKRVIVTIHGLDWQRSKWGGFAEKFLLFGEKTAVRYADEIIVLSRNVQKYFKDTYGRDTVFIPNGINRPDADSGDCSLIKEKFGLEKDGYILFLGRLVPEKCPDLLIKEYKELGTDKKLVIAGGVSHTDEYVATLKVLADADKNIVFTGFVEGETLEQLYRNAYIYCLPSALEGMPLSLLEAMSFGCCCLTSDIPECTEVCGENAESFESGNGDALKAKLAELLANPEKVNGFRQVSGDYICGKYNWDTVTEQTLNLYRGNA